MSTNPLSNIPLDQLFLQFCQKGVDTSRFNVTQMNMTIQTILNGLRETDRLRKELAQKALQVTSLKRDLDEAQLQISDLDAKVAELSKPKPTRRRTTKKTTNEN